MAHSVQHLADGLIASLGNYPAPRCEALSEGLLLTWVRFSYGCTSGLEVLLTATGTTMRPFDRASDNSPWHRIQSGAVATEVRMSLQKLYGR